jgi:hypothetical protein
MARSSHLKKWSSNNPLIPQSQKKARTFRAFFHSLSAVTSWLSHLKQHKECVTKNATFSLPHSQRGNGNVAEKKGDGVIEK